MTMIVMGINGAFFLTTIKNLVPGNNGPGAMNSMVAGLGPNHVNP
jgi:hypothetical protein